MDKAVIERALRALAEIGAAQPVKPESHNEYLSLATLRPLIPSRSRVAQRTRPSAARLIVPGAMTWEMGEKFTPLGAGTITWRGVNDGNRKERASEESGRN
jgi:hypothetical protein